MDDTDKLNCKEEMDVSDVEHSTNDENEEKPKKKKRRKREIDLIKLSDNEDSDEDSATRRGHRFSPGPHSPASHREPRACVLKASQKRRPLSRLLEQLLRNLEKRDPNQFFAWPVNDNFAPNYSKIIKRPMDFCTMKQKIDDNEYRSLNCFINDFKLICNNAMKYNKAGTVYHKAARKLLHIGLKQLTPQKLRPLGNMLTFMYEIPIRELGFDIGKMDLQKVLKRSGSPLKSGGSETEEATPGDERTSGDSDRVKLKMSRARDQHRRMLAKKAFPRMDSSGKTTLCLVTDVANRNGSDAEQMTLGQLVGRLSQGTGTLHTLREDRRNFVKGVKPLNYGPFSSYAPSHDGTFATLTKDESHLLYHTLASETGQSNVELLRFAADSPWAVLYDMETLFPAHPTANEEDKPTDVQPEAPIKVDLDSIRSLSELGIDVEYLADIEDDVRAATMDYGIGPTLATAAQLIQDLAKEQTTRLSAPPPQHLSLIAKPNATEQELAASAASQLKTMVGKIPPRHLTSVNAIRAAMGVTLDHLETPMSAEHDLVDPEASDRDSVDCKP